MHRKPRRILAGVMVVLGALLIWLAPEASTFGYVILLLGIAIEVVGIFLERKTE
ncbi:MAG: hypothetical protein OEU36_15270 [Gammaproteobacteria bacterium]|nr:hypothetical protein [Gammaproteobacteria bacterium]